MEAYYNVGRAYHQIGMFAYAIPFYELALGIDRPFGGADPLSSSSILTGKKRIRGSNLEEESRKRRRLCRAEEGGGEGREQKEMKWWDVRAEAAYNLSRIYMRAGLLLEAERIVREFLTVG